MVTVILSYINLRYIIKIIVTVIISYKILYTIILFIRYIIILYDIWRNGSDWINKLILY